MAVHRRTSGAIVDEHELMSACGIDLFASEGQDSAAAAAGAVNAK
jgi:hypothetical protein